MCGITGFINASKSLEDLKEMQKSLIHRGPDSQGYYYENGVGLAHTRLSIIDLSESASQPFLFEHLVLVYNGEIYNYKEIREELKSKGYLFETNSDTEVLIKGFHYWGTEVVHKLIGMFAFSIYNKHSEELYLFRDRLGVKPLFYDFSNKAISFSSELKTFLKYNHNIEYDDTGLIDFLRYGYTTGSHTLFKNIKRLAPGSYLKFANGELKTEIYWDPCDFVLDPLTETNEERLIDQFEEILISSFKYRMVSDVPVGIFFSGGLDSTALVALLSKHFGKVNTFTIGFDNPAFDESIYAKPIANFFKTNHTEKILNLDETKSKLSEFYNIYDEPFYDTSGIPTSLVSEVAKENGMKVVLSSEGGDELLAGYPRYSNYRKLGDKLFKVPYFIRKPLGNLLLLIDNTIGATSFGNRIGALGQLLKSDNWLSFYKSRISNLTDSSVSKFTKCNPIDTNASLPDKIINSNLSPEELFMLWDLKYLLPDDFLVKVDRATMYHGIESRDPFLDHRLVEFCLRLPLEFKLKNGQTKYLLRKVLERYIPNSYFDRPKMGFSIPLFDWFKKDLDVLLKTELSKRKFNSAWPMLNYEWIKKQLKIYYHSKKIDKELNLLLIWKYLGLMLWHEKHVKK